MHASEGIRAASLLVAVAIAGASAPARAPSASSLSEGGSTWERSPFSEASGFEYSIRRVRRGDLPHSWRPGCPVPPRQLRLVRVSHHGFDGEVKTGRLVVRRKHARPIVRVMRRLYRAAYPIKRMRLVDRYGGRDRRSMEANNTSAFNCRTATESGSWSEHAYGRAIDINPVQNPYVSSSGVVLPERGRRFVDRSLDHPAMIHDGDPVVRAFRTIGWSWGGTWASARDYQHFSLTGR